MAQGRDPETSPRFTQEPITASKIVCGRGALEEIVRQEARDSYGHHAGARLEVPEGWRDIASMVNADGVDMTGPRARYNIAPTDQIPTLQVVEEVGFELYDSRWGWRHPALGKPVFNARIEEIGDNPMWREAWTSNHACLVLSGFYEWRGGERRPPVYVTRRDGRPLVMAALQAYDEEQDRNVTATLTQAAPDWFQGIHDRIPVLLDPKDAQAWADTRYYTSDERYLDLIHEPREQDYEIRSVSTDVNNTRNDGAHLIAEQKAWF